MTYKDLKVVSNGVEGGKEAAPPTRAMLLNKKKNNRLSYS